MATKFKKLDASMDQMTVDLDQFESSDEYKNVYFASNEVNGEFDIVVESNYLKILSFDAKLFEFDTEIQPMHKKALEKDPEKQIYGQGMVTKILKAVGKFEKLRERVEVAKKQWEVLYEPVKQRKELALKRAEEEVQRKKQAELEEAIRQQKIREEQAAREAQLRKERELREEQEMLERERIAEEKAKIDRKLFEAEREIRTQRKAEEEIVRRAKEKRIEDAKTMDVEDAINLMEDLNSKQNFNTMMKTLYMLLDNICNFPEDPKFRHIRKENDMIKRKLCIAFEPGIFMRSSLCRRLDEL
jgi:hypothetical protein